MNPCRCHPAYARHVDLDTAQLLTSAEGQHALQLAATMSDPDSLAAAERMRRDFTPQLAAAALSQIALRSRARAKLGERAEHMLWTPNGVEQATRASVSVWRARRLVAAGITTVIDIGCGIGADALAFLDAGLSVVGIELDPATAVLAEHNLTTQPISHAQARVITGDGVMLLDKVLEQTDGQICVFLDPARRTTKGRTWRVADLSPSWSFVEAQLHASYASCVKLGPGFPRELLPDEAEAVWVSDRGDLVECSLWRLPGEQDKAGTRSAMLLPSGVSARAELTAGDFDVAAPGKYLYEPDPAISRAGAEHAIAQAGPGSSPHQLWRLATGVGYLSSNERIDTPFATAFEVIQILDHHLPSLRAWVKQERIGTLEIKKRAIDIDPAKLRKQLRLKGPNSATVVLTPTINGVQALVVRRLKAER